MKRAALISLPKQDLVRPPAAIPILAKACDDQGYDYDFFDFNLWLYDSLPNDIWEKIDDNWIRFDSRFDSSDPWVKDFYQQLDIFLQSVEQYRPDLIAISIFTRWSAHCALEMINRLQQYRKQTSCTIVIGGSGIDTILPWVSPSPLCEWLLAQQKIDVFLHGEGEINFRTVLAGQLSGPGINNFDYHQIDDLDQFGYPSYQKVNAGQYHFIDRPSLTLNGSRGCVRKCTYCDVAKYWPKFRYKSGKNIADEIFHTWQQTGIEIYEFSDSLINGNLTEFRSMNNRLIELRNCNPDFQINYKGQFIVRDKKTFGTDDYRIMHEAGCDYIYVGVETFSEKIRYDMDKKFDNQSLDFHLEMCGLYRIPNLFLMIVGYPTETLDDHQKNLDSLYKYQHYSQAGIIEMITWGLTTSILPDTPLYHQQKALEIVTEYEDIEIGNTGNWNWVSLSNPGLTVHERIRRWIELTEVSHSLGYQLTRIDAVVGKLSQILDRTSFNKKILQIQ